MNKKLRLLVTGKCNNNCPLCCNNRFNISEIPVVDNIMRYEEINITGGEPLLYPERLFCLLQYINEGRIYTGNAPTIYLYTSILPTPDIYGPILQYLSGICYTPHDRGAAKLFTREAYKISTFAKLLPVHALRSLRLNIFPEVEDVLLDAETDFPDWKVKRMQWIKDCPVPDGEDFRRIMHPF